MARQPVVEPNTIEGSACLEDRFSNTSDHPEVNIGTRLRELRRQRQLTIRDLAERSGLSVNTLSMIENGKTSPSVSTMQIISRALDLPLAAFFETEKREKPIVFVPAADRPHASVDTAVLEHLGQDLAGNAVQPFLVTLDKGSGSGQNHIVHTGHEFVFCLSGNLTYQIDGNTYPLEPGDSLVFQSHLPHSWQNVENEPCRFLLILIPSDSRDTPADRHFPINQSRS